MGMMNINHHQPSKTSGGGGSGVGEMQATEKPVIAMCPLLAQEVA
jgi:hypothetical protein